MISRTLVIFIGALVVFALIWKALSKASEVTNAVIREKLKKGALVIDVRTPAEFLSGHYNRAKNIPVQELQGRLSELGDKNQPIVVYCASGMRSAMAAKILTQAGFTDVINAGTARRMMSLEG